MVNYHILHPLVLVSLVFFCYTLIVEATEYECWKVKKRLDEKKPRLTITYHKYPENKISLKGECELILLSLSEAVI